MPKYSVRMRKIAPEKTIEVEADGPSQALYLAEERMAVDPQVSVAVEHYAWEAVDAQEIRGMEDDMKKHPTQTHGHSLQALHHHRYPPDEPYFVTGAWDELQRMDSTDAVAYCEELLRRAKERDA